MTTGTKLAALALLAIASCGDVWAVEPPIMLVWTHVDDDSDFEKDDYNIGIGPSSNLYSSTTYQDVGGDWSCVVRRHNSGGGTDWEYTGTGVCHDLAVGWAGDVVVVGKILSVDGDWDNHVFKLSSTGGVVFDRSWGNAFEDSIQSVKIGLFGSLYLNGVTFPGPTASAYSGQIHRLNGLTGAVVWTHEENDHAQTMTHRPVIDAYGRVFFRVSQEALPDTQFLKSLDGNGNLRWSVARSYVPSTWPHQLFANDSLIIDGTGTLYLSDYANFNGVLRLSVTSISNDGDPIWSTSVPIPGGECLFPPQIVRNGLAEVYVAGGCQNFSTQTGMTVAKFDAVGSVLWTREWLDPEPSDPLDGVACPLGIAVDDVGQVVLGLRTSAGPATVGYSASGNLVWEEFVTGVAFGSEREMVVNSSGYPSINALHEGVWRTYLWSFGSPRDWWEADNNWTLAHPWIHPGIPPQYHNFFDDVDDWISFHARTGQTYRITATTTGAALPGVQLQLYAGNGQTLLGTALPGGGFSAAGVTEMIWTAPAGGSYHVRMKPTDDTAGVGREYTVTVTGDQGSSHLWSKQYGGVDKLDGVSDAVEGPDGSHWVVGHIDNGSQDAGLHRFSEDGQLISSRHYGGSLTDIGRAVVINSNGNPVIAVGTDSFSSSDDILLVEVDAESGSPLMVRRYDMDVTEDVSDLQRAPDGGYYLLGSNDLFGPDGIWMLRLDAAGEIVWSYTFFSADGSNAEGIAMTVGDSLVVAGRVGTDGLLMKVSHDGDLQWAKLYDLGGLANAWLSSVVETADGRLMAVGTHYVTPAKLWGLSTDSIGDPLWSIGYDQGRGHTIVESAEQGFIIAGETTFNDSGDGWLLGLDGNGALLWERAYGGSVYESFTELDLADDGGAIATGLTIAGPLSTFDLITVRTDRVGLLDGECSMALPTGTVAAALDVDTTLWASTVSELSPIVSYDEPVGWGNALTATPPAVCELHEPGELVGPLLFTDHDTMTWGGPLDDSYSVYRGGNVADTGSFACLATGLTVATHDDAENPASGELRGYVVVAGNDLGEGPMGTHSDGKPRPHPASCLP